jgi:hypothetical protein
MVSLPNLLSFRSVSDDTPDTLLRADALRVRREGT